MLDNIELLIFDIGGTLKVSHKLDWYEDTRAALERLSKQYRLVTGANQPSSILGYMETSGFAQYFTHIYLSESIGYFKPDHQFFLHIPGEEGVPLDRVAMIGDELENDIEPANALGLRSIWIRRGLGLELAIANDLVGKIVPDHTIDTLDQLR
jgi:FMN phosphatase YigB (HAD superfamily)